MADHCFISTCTDTLRIVKCVPGDTPASWGGGVHVIPCLILIHQLGWFKITGRIPWDLWDPTQNDYFDKLIIYFLFAMGLSKNIFLVPLPMYLIDSTFARPIFSSTQFHILWLLLEDSLIFKFSLSNKSDYICK